MKKSNFLDAIKNAPDGEIIIEIDFFLYSYERAVSLISLDGRDYLCLECGRPMYQQYEKEIMMAKEPYHVYLLDGEPTWVDDPELRARIIPIFEENKRSSVRGEISLGELELDELYF